MANIQLIFGRALYSPGLLEWRDVVTGGQSYILDMGKSLVSYWSKDKVGKVGDEVWARNHGEQTTLLEKKCLQFVMWWCEFLHVCIMQETIKSNWDS